MPIPSRVFLASLLATGLMACGGEGPGALAGTWQASDGLPGHPMAVTFRDGETESLGVIEKVTYRTQGQDVLVTYTDGLAKGSSLRFTLTGPDTVNSPFGAMQRVR